MDNPVRVGVIGAGAVVAAFHLPTLVALPNVDVLWVFDIDREHAARMAKRFSVPGVATSIADAPEVDVVLVATPVGARTDVIREVAKRRWHAFCEKPFATTPEEHDRIVAMLTAVDRRAGIGLVRRFYPSTRRARDVVASELLGPVESILAGEGLRARKFGRSEWFQGDARASGGGVFAETGTHLVDQVFTIVGAAGAEIQQCRQERIRGLEMDTRIKATIATTRAREVPFTVGVSRLNDLYNGIVVRCRHGEVRVATDPEAGVELFDKQGASVGAIPGAAKPGIYSAIRAEWVDFIEACSDPTAPETNTGLLTTKFVAQAYARATITSRGHNERGHNEKEMVQ